MVSLFLVVSMIISVPVCALEPVEEKTITPTTPIGYLVSDDGVVYEIEGKLVNAPCAVMSNESNEGISQTYMYDLSSLSHRAGGSNTVHDTDKDRGRQGDGSKTRGRFFCPEKLTYRGRSAIRTPPSFWGALDLLGYIH